MPGRIQAVLFDLGYTLMFARQPWPEVLARADLAVARSLCAQGWNVPVYVFAHEFGRRKQAHYQDRQRTLIEFPTLEILREQVKDMGCGDVPEDDLRTAVEAMYAITRRNWAPDPQARPLLVQLKAAGYRLGLASNAGDDRDVRLLVRRQAITPFLDFILTSSACGFRKPHARMFELALEHWSLPPDRVAMVGDTLEADILGANRMGMLAVYIRHYADPHQPAGEARPDLVIDTLGELPQGLESVL